MHVPSAVELLSVWEKGFGSKGPERALMLLSAAFPDEPLPAHLPLGERDARLLALREDLFGSVMPCVVSCPACEEKLDVQLTIPDLLQMKKHVDSHGIHVSHEGLTLRMRLPNSLDLLDLRESDSTDINARRLFDHCVLEAQGDHGAVAGAEVPDSAIDMVGRVLSEADPMADIRIHLRCSVCLHGWDAPFAIASYLWIEIDRWAKRVLEDVHLIASAYGWGEQEILALSPLRRQYYLDVIAAERGAGIE